MAARPKHKSDRVGSRPEIEWIGGSVTLPFYVDEEEGRFRPRATLWLELPSGLVVGTALSHPDDEVSIGEALLDALHKPAAGAPRRPGRIRVADPADAAAVRAAVPDIEVRVAPTPELKEIATMMAEHVHHHDLEHDPPSYLEGDVDPRVVGKLFRAAGALHDVAPWDHVDDSQVLRMDIPDLGLQGACVSVIGGLGMDRGFVMFPSADDFERFLEAGETAGVRDGPSDLGTSWMLCLNFASGEELPEELLEEVEQHGWQTVDEDLYPWVERRDRGGAPQPPSERDVRLAAACATSLSAFFFKHRDLFGSALHAPLCESYQGGDDLEVRLTHPYKASHLFAVNDPSPLERKGERAKIGRNQPCPCGSAMKYKKCCLQNQRFVDSGASAGAAAHDLDARVVRAMSRFAARRFGDDWWMRSAEDFFDHLESAQLAGPWSLFCCAVEGRPIVDWYLEERRKLPEDERSWLEAQRHAWLSAWEVLGVAPGRSVTLRDLLSGEEREVSEVSGSKVLGVRDVLLGRVVDYQGLSVLGGCHPRVLPPVPAAEVVERFRKRLRRKRAVPVDRLRGEKFGRYAIARWEEAVLDLDHWRRVLPKLHNTDGDELLQTADHFDVADGGGGGVEIALAAIPGVEPPEPGGDQEFVFTRPANAVHRGWENTILGRAVLEGDRLRLETNSTARADVLRAQVEGACGDRLRHRARVHSDPAASLAGPPDAARQPLAAEVPGPELDDILLQFKTRHYADWTDHPLPALDGKTPREAIRTKTGKAQVDLLLKEFEHSERRLPRAQRFDFSDLRRQLGL